tara:strand:+ start:742 stop:1044 length:303 start_codon:yes stop_codon:yes gene_type:complete
MTRIEKDYILHNKAVLFQSEKDYSYFCEILESNSNYPNITFDYIKDMWEFCMLRNHYDGHGSFCLISASDARSSIHVSKGVTYVENKGIVDSNEFIRALQ